MYYIEIILILLLIISIFGYIFSVLREKYYLKKNIIILENKNIDQEDLKDLDIYFLLHKGVKFKAGDEVKIETDEKIYKGTLLGGKFNEGILKILTRSNEVKVVRLRSILEVKVTREYGKFFTS